MTKTEVALIEREVIVEIINWCNTTRDWEAICSMNDLALSIRDIFAKHGVMLDD